MATMNRNVNLEEINSDAFMGISYLNHQSILQKAVFIGGIVCAVGINLLGSFVWNININLTLALTLAPLLIGVAFGCNYNEDLPLVKYFKLLVSKPSKAYYSRPTEDLEQLHKSAERIREEEAVLRRQQEKASDEAQKKLLLKLGAFALAAVVALIAALALIKNLKTDEIHHTVQAVRQYLQSEA